MALLCLDLDNTLVDRAGAYRMWASGFVDRHDIDPHEVGWMIEVDLDSLAEREAVFDGVRIRFHLAMSIDEMMADYRASVPELIQPMPGAIEALAAARDRGWCPWLVTNGEVDVQEAKLEATGLKPLLDGCVISAEAGMAKPDPAIFELCATRAGQTLAGAWMIGDNGPVDIGGADRAGIRSVWLHRHRHWEQLSYEPTAQAASMLEAVELIGPPTR